ncbi:MAG TPA: hypothetical protein VMJ32_00075 [Pirellulales bacterium]|nr:hypothetical protein [Pirellulales bacterium]
MRRLPVILSSISPLKTHRSVTCGELILCAQNAPMAISASETTLGENAAENDTAATLQTMLTVGMRKDLSMATLVTSRLK